MEIEEILYNYRTYYRKPNHPDKRCHYFRLRGRPRGSKLSTYLHRQVWIDNKGEIPKGFQIHHKDHNPANNSIENLECISLRDHLKEHAKEREKWAFSNENKKNLDNGRKHGIAWMKSDKGAEHARRLGIIQREKSKVMRNCYICKQEFEAIDLIKKAMYCSIKCKSIAAKNKKKTVICVICGKSIEVNKYCDTTSCKGKCTALKGHLSRKSKMD